MRARSSRSSARRPTSRLSRGFSRRCEGRRSTRPRRRRRRLQRSLGPTDQTCRHASARPRRVPRGTRGRARSRRRRSRPHVPRAHPKSLAGASRRRHPRRRQGGTRVRPKRSRRRSRPRSPKSERLAWQRSHTHQLKPFVGAPDLLSYERPVAHQGLVPVRQEMLEGWRHSLRTSGPPVHQGPGLTWVGRRVSFSNESPKVPALY